MPLGVIFGALLGGLLNRLRGGLFSKFIPAIKGGMNGTIVTLIFAGLVALATINPMIGLAAGVAYFIGESFGWSKWINCIPGRMSQAEYNEKWLGYKNPATDRFIDTWVADRFNDLGVVNEGRHYLPYIFVGMTTRGAMWWIPVFAVFAFFGLVTIPELLACVGLLSITFPVTYWLAARTVSSGDYVGRAEVIYGLVYGAVLGLILL